MRVMLLSLLCAGLLTTAIAGEASRPAFADLGPQVGEFLPELPLTDLEGNAVSSNELAHGLTLLVTGSYTCPKTRSSFPGLELLAKRYDKKLTVAVVYVIEAHPVIDPCPYKSVEDVTPANRAEGILFRQPRTMPARTKLALDFSQRMHSNLPIYLDAMDDHAWTTLGGAPNLGLLLTDNRRVLVRQAWFDAAEMEKSIQAWLKPEPKPDQEGEQERKQAEAVAADRRLVAAFAATGITVDEILKPFADGDADGARQRLAAFPALATYTSRHQERRGRGEEDTAWRLAIRGRQPAVVAALLDAGVGPDTEDALQVAAQNGDVALLDLLLARGAAVDGRSHDGVTALDDAAYSGQRACAERLLVAKASKSLHAAVALGDLAFVEGLIIRDPSRVHRPDGKQRTPLMYAAANGQLTVARLLLAHGANPGRKVGHYETPLTLAVDRRDAELVRLLLKHRADPALAPSWDGNSLHHAAKACSAEIMRLLLETWADPNVSDYGSETTPLLYAAGHADPHTLAVLIEFGAHLTAVTGHVQGGCAPPFPYLHNALHLAVMHGRLDNVRFLAAQGVDPNGRNHAGRTPLHLVTDIDNRQLQIPMLEALLAAGAKIDRLDGNNNTCLDLATSRRLEAAVAFLRGRGAKLAAELPKPADRDESPPNVNYFQPNELLLEEEEAAPRPLPYRPVSAY